MNILILSINHQIQPARIINWSSDGVFQDFEQAQKEAFAQYLYDLIHERQIEFVGEEARHGDESICQRVCAHENCDYANVEMLPEERQTRDIPRDYADNSDLPEEERARYNREREEYMCAATIREAGQVNRVLVICGRLHAEAIAAEFQQRGHCTEIIDLQQQQWYVEDWFNHLRDL